MLLTDEQGEKTERVAEMLAFAIVANGIIAAVVLVAHYGLKLRNGRERNGLH